MWIKQKETPWSDSDTQDFVMWYRSLYGDTSKETWTWELPTITKAEERLHKRIWKRKIRFSLWNRAYRLYVHKGWRRGNYLEKIYSELYQSIELAKRQELDMRDAWIYKKINNNYIHYLGRWCQDYGQVFSAPRVAGLRKFFKTRISA